jgi:ABC-2 type transport system permease protein
MSAFRSLTFTEARVFAREPAGVFWGLVFPALLLIVLGFVFPGAREPSVDLDGYRLVDLYAPIVLTLGLTTLAFATLPVILATYRERGVLRRISTTPAHPRLMVLAQLTVHVALAVAATGLALIVALVVFAVPAPGNPGGFAASLLLAATALLAVGMVVGAVARTAAAGQGIGMALYFPSLFFAGVYLPRGAMPEGLQAVSDLTPSGAAVQAVTDTWAGRAPTLSSLLVLAAFALGGGWLAANRFRWE